ncbi:hypothetical protein Tco_1429151 [Tanacetum coccineum]
MSTLQNQVKSITLDFSRESQELASCLKGCLIPILSARVVSFGAFIVTIHTSLFIILVIRHYSPYCSSVTVRRYCSLEKKLLLMDKQAIRLLLKEQTDALHAQIAALAADLQAAKLI